MRTLILAAALVASSGYVGRVFRPADNRPAAPYDVLITRGFVVDGTGRPGTMADVAIRSGRIVRVGRMARSQASRVIDAAGRVVAPGFVDVGTHADDIADRPAAARFVRMGVTTIVAGNCGNSALDVGEALSRVRDDGAAVNYATLVGHNTVRRAVMGIENDLPTPAELARMKSFVWKAMADGAVGFSTGLEDVPGVYSKPPEIIELARVAANADGVYATHLRSYGTALDAAVAEAVRVGEATGARVEISHLNAAGTDDRAKALALIDDARANGVDIQADIDATGEEAGNLLSHPEVAFMFDRGSPARVFGEYVRRRRVLTLEEAVRRMTSLAATQFRLGERGLIRAGYAADVVVFDPARAANAVAYLLVNGVVVVNRGTQTDARPGQVIARSLMLRR